MKTPILLHIPEPCNESWDAMTPQDKGRHCQSCNKVVVDFSVMTDRQVLDYFKNATGNTCGRFHNDQLQRPLIEPHKQPSKWNYFIASIASFFVGLKLMAQPKAILGKVINPQQQTTNKNTANNSIKGEVRTPELIIVSGKVVDEKNFPIAGASITIDKAFKGVISDKDGKFTCKAKSISTLTIRAVNYETKRIEIKGNEDILIKLVSDSNLKNGVFVQVPMCSVKRTNFTGTENNKIKGKITDEKGIAIADASIQIKGTKMGTLSKVDGGFELNKLGGNTKLTIVVSSLGYETKTIEVESKDLRNSLNVVLKLQSQNLEELVINSSYSSHIKGRYTVGYSTTIYSTKKVDTALIKDSIIKPIQKLLDIEPVKIYPNPVAKNTNVHIAIKQTGTWELQLFNMQSNLLAVKEVNINTANQIIDYTIPNNIASGNYFLKLINKESKKMITEKIIVL